jgi:hypothetical protein
MREIGIEAYSCDIEPCSGGHPDWHIQGDVVPLLAQEWDMIVAFPPCTYLTNAGTRHFSRKVNPEEKVVEREKLRQEAFDFFMLFVNAKSDRIAVENPVGWINSHYRKPDQIIHPYFFGDNARKRTCLWLKNLPLLKPTNMLPPPKPRYTFKTGKNKGLPIHWCDGTSGGKSGAKIRSKTFPGVAKAMAEQWGKILETYKG